MRSQQPYLRLANNTALTITMGSVVGDFRCNKTIDYKKGAKYNTTTHHSKLVNSTQLSVGGWCGDYNANFGIVERVVLLHHPQQKHQKCRDCEPQSAGKKQQ